MAELNPDVRIFENLDAVSYAAGALFVEAAAEAVAERGRFLVALSGGDTPVRLYGLLSKAPLRAGIDWGATHAFWGDERCVPVEDLQNNYRQIKDILFAHVPIPPVNLHRIKTEMESSAAALDYALVLKEYSTPPLAWPRFDVVLLGMGSDGHTASLFPGSEVAASAPVLAVSGQYEDRPSERVTLTPVVFNSAHKVFFLVTGEGKAQMLKRVLYGEPQPELLPAQRIQPQDGSVTWLVDRAAAGQL